GNAYFTGVTSGDLAVSPGVIFPSSRGGGDAFLTKLSPSGALLYSTYLGGGAADEGLAIAVNNRGDAIVGGATGSLDFPTSATAVQPTMPNASRAGFITQVNTTAAQILYSTFLGGDVSDSVNAIALDARQKIHVTGSTSSRNFPITATAWDRACGGDNEWAHAEHAFYTKLDPSKAGVARLLYSTFLGGSNSDRGEATAGDQNGRAWVTGRTSSSRDFPVIEAAQPESGGDYDAFIAQIDPVQSGPDSLRYSSLLGGAAYDEGTGISVGSL